MKYKIKLSFSLIVYIISFLLLGILAADQRRRKNMGTRQKPAMKKGSLSVLDGRRNRIAPLRITKVRDDIRVKHNNRNDD